MTVTSAGSAAGPTGPTGFLDRIVVRRRRGGVDGDVTAVAVSVGPGADRPEVLAGVDRLRDLGVDPDRLVDRDPDSGAPGTVLRVPLAPVGGTSPIRTAYLVGVGDLGSAALRTAAGALARAARDEPALDWSLPADLDDERVRAVAESAALGGYRFRVSDGGRRRPGPMRLDLAGLVTPDGDGPDGDAETAAAVERARVVAEAVALARDLTNTPSLVKSPQWLAEQAVRVAEQAGIDCAVRNERALDAEGFGGILAVGAGSVRPPRLIELCYTPKAARGHVVLVGKGITFDSGGLSLKPTDGMVAMKTDMAGGAAVIAALGALPALGIRSRVTGLVPAAENLPSGTAQRPGDVIHHYGGRTVEVLNTDAEGRLVLADALSYAVTRLRPTAVVDLATLTGAATLGLGRRHGALYATHEPLADQLLAAADAAGERLWRMPLVEDYRAALDSPIADLANVARDERVRAGSIVAALFLREFTGGRPWAHLDIAGPARAEADEGDVTKGATGYGVRLLLRWLEALDAGAASTAA